jgi:hypothetical protein
MLKEQYKSIIFLLFMHVIPSFFGNINNVAAAIKNKKPRVGKTVDDDDVRYAISVACERDCPVATYNCNLALAPFLLQENYEQLLGPEKCECDKQCPLPVALACASKVADCLEHFKTNLNSRKCSSCLDMIGHHCCPCLAYEAGIIHNKLVGKKVCEKCPAQHHPEPKDLCEHPPCDECEGEQEWCSAKKHDKHKLS